MKKAQPEDRSLIIQILASSFEDNQSINYIIQKDNKKFRIRSLMEYSIDVCLLFGDVWVSEDKNACALVLYPHLKKTSLKSIWLDFKLAVQAIHLSGIGRAMRREALINEKRLKVPMAYLWFIGVNPLFQYQGIGSQLLQEILINAKNQDLPVYLETSTLKNLPWYQRFDFQIYNQLNLSYTLYFLKSGTAK